MQRNRVRKLPVTLVIQQI